MRKREIFVLGIILLSFFIGIYFYPKMPEKMATHWNLQGEGDRYAQKFSGLFLIPFISLGVFLLFFIYNSTFHYNSKNRSKHRRI